MRYRRSCCALQSQLQALNQWMTDMEQFLATDDAATAADTETLQLQLKESAVRHNSSTPTPSSAQLTGNSAC